MRKYIDDYKKTIIEDENEVITLRYKGQEFDFENISSLIDWINNQNKSGGIFYSSDIKKLGV